MIADQTLLWSHDLSEHLVTPTPQRTEQEEGKEEKRERNWMQARVRHLYGERKGLSWSSLSCVSERRYYQCGVTDDERETLVQEK